MIDLRRVVAQVGALALLASAAGATTLRFENGHWWEGDGFASGSRTVVDGVFAPAGPPVEPDHVVDLEGAWVVPPLADAHTHLAADTRDPSSEIVDLARSGILHFKNPNSTSAGVARGRSALEKSGLPVRALFSGSGITSPGGHPSQIYEAAGASDGWLAVDSAASLEEAWERLLRPEPDFVKVYLEGAEDHVRVARDPEYRGKRGMDPALLPEVMRRANEAGLPVSAHVRSAEDFRIAVRAGIDEINHLPLEEITAEDADACAAAGVRVVTTVLSHRPTHGVENLDAIHRTNLERLHRAGVELALGTDNGAVDVVDEILAVDRLEALPRESLLAAATTGSILACAPHGEPAAGELAPGQEATFLVLDGNPLEDLAALRAIRTIRVRGETLALPEAEAKRESLVEAMMREVHTSGFDVALAKCREWFREGNEAVDLTEAELNTFGYAMLQHGQAEGAVKVFELVVELFPHSVNALDSLAEGQVAAGDLAGAAETSREVLRRLPEVHDVADGFRAQLEAHRGGTHRGGGSQIMQLRGCAFSLEVRY